MTFTDQNFTHLPFLNIRQTVLSVGSIQHLSWSPELGRKNKNRQMEMMRWSESNFVPPKKRFLYF